MEADGYVPHADLERGSLRDAEDKPQSHLGVDMGAMD